MAAWQIPLDVKSPQIESPMEVLKGATSIADVMNRGRLQAQQEQENQMKLQEQILQRATTQAINQAVQANMKTNPDGTFSIDHGGVMKAMAQKGVGSAIPGYQMNAIKAQEAAADLMKKETDNHNSLLTSTSQILQGVRDDDSYQTVLPQARENLTKLGVNPQALPDKWDPVRIGTLVAAGQKATDYNKSLMDAAEMAKWAGETNKTVGDFEKDMQGRIAASTNDADLGRALSVGTAIMRNQPPERQAPYREILNSLPNVWTSDVATKAQDALTPAGERSKAVLERLGVAARTAPEIPANPSTNDQKAWESWRATLAPSVRAQIPEVASQDAWKQARYMGLTPDQRFQVEHSMEEMKKVGSEAELARRAASGDASAKRALDYMSDQKIKEEVGKQMGVFKALTGGVSGGGDTGGVQIPEVAPGQPGRVQLAAKNNNPGNLMFAGQAGAEKGEAGFAKFSTPEAGYNALVNNIKANSGLTLGQYITKFAPPEKNDTAGYIRNAAAALNAKPSTPLNSIDPEELAAFQAQQESSTKVGPRAQSAGQAVGQPALPNEPGQRNEASLAKVDAGLANQIRAIADGRATLPAYSNRNPMPNVIRDLLYQYDPSYDFTNPSARMKMAGDIAKAQGPTGAVNAFNTALRHGSTLSDLIEKLNNSAFRRYNSIANWLTKEKGSPEVNEFNNVRNKFAQELTRAWRGVGGTEADIQAEQKSLNDADSPAALRNVMADNIELLQGKIQETESAYERTMGKKIKLISPEAEKAIAKVNAKAGRGAAPKEGDTQEYRGDTYKVVDGVWKKQAKAQGQ